MAIYNVIVFSAVARRRGGGQRGLAPQWFSGKYRKENGWTIYYYWPPRFFELATALVFGLGFNFLLLFCVDKTVYKQEIKIPPHTYVSTYISPKGLSLCTFPVVRKSFKENKSFLCILSDRLFPKKKTNYVTKIHHIIIIKSVHAGRYGVCPYRLLRGAMVRRRYLDAMITEKCSNATIARMITKPRSWSWWIHCSIR